MADLPGLLVLVVPPGLAPDLGPLPLHVPTADAAAVGLCALHVLVFCSAAAAGEEALAAHPPLTTLMTRLSATIIEGRPMPPHAPDPAWAIAASSAAAAAAASAAEAAAAADEGGLPPKSSRASGLLLLPEPLAALDDPVIGRARVPLRLAPMLGEHVPGDDGWTPPPPPPPPDGAPPTTTAAPPPPGRCRLWPARVGAPGDGIA